MLCRDDQGQFIFVQHHAMQTRLAGRQVADADIQRTVEQSPLDFQAGQFIDLHHQMRLRLAHPFEHLRNETGMHGLQYTDGQCAQRLTLEVAERLPCPLQAIEQRQGVVVQRVGREGRQQALAIAFEQAHIEVLLEVADLLGQRRLGDGQALGGPAHVAFFIDRDEITQLLEIHKYYLSKMLGNRNG
ncbi:hypothetical protein D3C86_1135080 [compost metagenome]